mmetsp:Transcript_47059/g.152516  ORF Transcript_47059/g.152516 Transcript_47059/m.152516 type:complete len:237 (+) Transcript_47059:370-1080(+)
MSRSPKSTGGAVAYTLVTVPAGSRRAASIFGMRCLRFRPMKTSEVGPAVCSSGSRVSRPATPLKSHHVSPSLEPPSPSSQHGARPCRAASAAASSATSASSCESRMSERRELLLATEAAHGEGGSVSGFGARAAASAGSGIEIRLKPSPSSARVSAASSSPLAGLAPSSRAPSNGGGAVAAQRSLSSQMSIAPSGVRCLRTLGHIPGCPSPRSAGAACGPSQGSRLERPGIRAGAV